MTATTTETLTAQITARLLSGETPQSIADGLDLETAKPEDHDGMAVLLPGWMADDGNAEVEFPAADSGEEAAQEYVDTGEWGDEHATWWIDVWAWRHGIAMVDGLPEMVACCREQHTVEVEPEEPECGDGHDGHDFRAPHCLVGGIKENPGCWGHGGGVIYHEVCVRCGLCRTTDTWAQRSDTGQQGLRSITYHEPEDYDYPVISPEDYRRDVGESYDEMEDYA